MTDLFKDVFDTAQQRIRSPFLGSIIFAFVAFNWRVLFYLFFADVSVADRIAYFDDPTTPGPFYWSPLIWGVILALIMPFLKPAGAFVARHPNKWLHNIQTVDHVNKQIVALEEEERKTSAEANLEAARAKASLTSVKAEADLAVARAEGAARVTEVEERIKIDAAKRDAEVQDAFDPETAKRLQEQIDELRERPATITASQGKIGEAKVSTTPAEGEMKKDHRGHDISEGWERKLWDSLSDSAKTVLRKVGASDTGKVDFKAQVSSGSLIQFEVDGGIVAEKSNGRAMSIWREGLDELSASRLVEKDAGYYRIMPRGMSLFTDITRIKKPVYLPLS